MTDATPAVAPLILSSVSLAIFFLAAVGWIATAVMAWVSLRRQIHATSREAWMHEFRENVALLLTIEHATRAPSQQRIILLIAERDARQLPAGNFFDALQRFLNASGDENAAQALTMAAAVDAMSLFASGRGAGPARAGWVSVGWRGLSVPAGAVGLAAVRKLATSGLRLRPSQQPFIGECKGGRSSCTLVSQ